MPLDTDKPYVLRVAELIYLKIYEIKKQLKNFLELQLKDNVKARLINARGSNKYVSIKGKAVRSQLEQYRYFESLLD